MGDKYYRLVCLVVNVCAELLRKYFLKLAQSDTAITYTDLKTYLTASHTEINQLVIKKIIRGDQYGLLFPSTRNPKESEWDVTLIITLLQHIFKIDSNATLILNTIRDERNMLQHRSNTEEMTDIEFDECWSRLEMAAKDLAKLVSDTSGTYEKQIAVISEEKVNDLPGLGDALKTFYEEIIKQMAYDMQILKDRVLKLENTTDSAARNSQEACNVLHKVTAANGAVTHHPSNHCCKGGDFFKYMTSTILENYSKNLANIDQTKLEEATDLLRRQRMVTIYGPAKSGKTSISVALAKSYMPEEVLFLHSPDNIRSIDFQTTLLVVIDDFGGKYRFDWMKVNEWLACFDLLHEAVTAGKLNVVVTCETEKLQNCIKKVAMHPLLSYQLQLTKIKVLVKPEPSENCITSVIPRGSNSSNSLSETSVVVSRDDMRSVQSVGRYSVRIDRDNESCVIFGCCTLPGGEILLADNWNNRLKKLDEAYNVISICDLIGHFRSVCYIGNNVALVAVDKQLVFVDVSSMKVRNTVTTNHWCWSITCHNDKFYVMSRDTVYMYTLDGNNRSTIYKLQYSYYTQKIEVSGDGNRIYITNGNTGLITIDNFGNHLNSLVLPGDEARDVCVDDRGNVWVAGLSNNKLYQVSADGARLLGTVTVDDLKSSLALCYDRHTSSLIAAGFDDIHVIRLD